MLNVGASERYAVVLPAAALTHFLGSSPRAKLRRFLHSHLPSTLAMLSVPRAWLLLSGMESAAVLSEYSASEVPMGVLFA